MSKNEIDAAKKAEQEAAKKAQEEAEAQKRAEQEAAAEKKKAEAARKPTGYDVVHPRKGWTGELLGVGFIDGAASVDDAKLALALTEYGCQVYDAGNHIKPALGTQTPAEQARIARSAAWAYP